MRAEPTAAQDRRKAVDLAGVALFALISITYFVQAIRLATHSPLWMDEVLALWTARMPDMASLWQALRGGSEFTPPLYDTMLHWLLTAGAESPLAIRLPSILAGYAAALAAGALLWRRAGLLPAAVGASAVLASGLLEYAVQARPYVFVVALLGWSIVVWDRLPDDRPAPAVRLALLSLLLGALVALHFYAVLFVGLVGLAEILCRLAEGRRPRLPVLGAIAVAGASILLWWPIMQAAAAFSGQDVLAPEYYGRPRWLMLPILYLVSGGWLVPVAVLGGFAMLVAKRATLIQPRLALLGGMLAGAPLLVFLFALLVSHSFSARYAIAMVLGLGLLAGWLLAQAGKPGRLPAMALLILMLLFPVGRDGGEIAKADRLQVLKLVVADRSSLPIVTGNGLRWFELAANLPPAQARRVHFLNAGAPASDPTNHHQVERWKAIDRTLAVTDAASFIRETPRFLLLVDPSGGADALPGWLRTRHCLPLLPADRPSLTEINPGAC